MKNTLRNMSLLIAAAMILIGCGSQSNNDYRRLMEENQTEVNNTTNNDVDYLETDADQEETDRIVQEETQQQLDVANTLVVTRNNKEVVRQNPYYANQQYTSTYTWVGVLSKNDDITVYSATVNRGNCRVSQDRFPMHLAFGDKGSIYVNDGCSILEVTLATDKGDFIYTFE